ncbi:kinase-like domain-containing protein [Podospora australis]|uniref:Kinase-like domain-containing protein n=1 Tax=Podospora australis TaxID=1536484 RepID=A0AAN6WNE7_9PEZI|nr:kinase-like domain-containing protein [Podospora australis]
MYHRRCATYLKPANTSNCTHYVKPPKDKTNHDHYTAGARWPHMARNPLLPRPAIERVCRQHLSISAKEHCTVTFHASGTFNKLYVIKSPERRLIMRVTLPVYPRHKTRAEVATLRWIGFEWILMEFMDGQSAHDRWRTLSMEQKAALTRQVATFQAELAGFGKFRGIGALEGVAPGLLVSHEFFMGDHLHYDIPRGPFISSHDWLSTELQIILLDQKAILEKPEVDEDDKEEADERISAAQKLVSVLDKVFTPTGGETEPEITGLYHDDLHLGNILVDEDGKIPAVLDWECVSAMPLWIFTEVPKFLDEEVREEEPQIDGYGDADDEHRMEYEATQLRKAYEARLRELWPEWLVEESVEKVVTL